MKKIALLLVAVFALTGVQAQIETPQPSPFTKIEQKVGLTDVTLEYSRPSMRGREVFGNLVPYSKLWRTGANKNTIITFSNNVTIGGKEVKAGSYAVFTKPGENTWEVIFYADTNNWGTPRAWDESKVAATINAEVVKMPMKIETFTMTFDDLTSNSAVLGILWEDVYVGAKFEVPTDKTVTDAIAKTMNGPSAQDYYAAAVYYKEAGKDINQAKTWMEKAIGMMEKPAFYQLRQLSLIYAKAGDKKKAIETAKKSLAGSKEAGNADYIKMNEDSLKEWGVK
ncbi:DUF2911 domain-containing protein [Cellulophaga omnivescoria]|uniref:DUF2911 domain-containing protein n=1 Tax=Cellulophaga omnivescoria TaxID=1888890 RepID=UPI0009878023|nr:DUF2911 domain-containing protein [Cellulophaga omnivescoria]WBU89305.1 DUF2911 domain-containing protein [Cellulophaga omnivescoria]WKB81311.1 DUF2911 domain-containing protein [Cellulophaga lytica]